MLGHIIVADFRQGFLEGGGGEDGELHLLLLGRAGAQGEQKG